MSVMYLDSTSQLKLLYTQITTAYLCGKLQARESFVQMCLQRTDHYKHESLRVTTQREL